jgi:hypothetical protein
MNHTNRGKNQDEQSQGITGKDQTQLDSKAKTTAKARTNQHVLLLILSSSTKI